MPWAYSSTYLKTRCEKYRDGLSRFATWNFNFKTGYTWPNPAPERLKNKQSNTLSGSQACRIVTGIQKQKAGHYNLIQCLRIDHDWSIFHSRAIAGATGCGSECARSFCLDAGCATRIISLSQLQIFFKCLQRNFTWTNCCIMLHPDALYFVQYFVHVRFRSQIPSWKKDFTQQISFSQIHDKMWLVPQKEVTIVTVVATELQCDIVWYTTCSLLFEYEEFKYFERPRPRPEPSLWRWAGSGCEPAVVCTSSLTEGVLSLVHRTVISDANHWIHVHIL